MIRANREINAINYTPSSMQIRNDLGEVIFEAQTGSSESTGRSLNITTSGTTQANIPLSRLDKAPTEKWLSKKPAEPLPFSQQEYVNFDSDATVVINSLGAGLNIGQEWDAIKDGDAMPGAYRNIYTTPELYKRIKAAGFVHVRIPCNFSNFTDTVSPWEIDPVILDKYFESVDNALDAGLIVIVDNHHHTGYLNASSGDSRRGGSLPRSEQLIRQSAMVVQVAQRLNSYDFNKVLFELENEPNTRFNADWNAYWPPMLSACRVANQDTIFLIGGSSWNNPSKLAEMPEITDTRTALVAHTYEPFSEFTHTNYEGGELTATWDDAKASVLAASLDVVKEQMELRGKPCVMTEGGAKNYMSQPHKNMYARDLRNLCYERGIPFSFWNAYGDFAIMSSSGYFPDGITEAITATEKAASYNIPRSAGENALALDKIVYAKGGSNSRVTHNLIGNGTPPVLEFTDDTITVVSGMDSGALVIPYAVMKSGAEDRIRPGRRFRFTLGSANGASLRSKISNEWVDALGSVAKFNWMPYPQGAGSTSSPRWGDHSPGVYEYECYVRDRGMYWLEDAAPLSFFITIDGVRNGDVITLKIEWLD